jgi:hypothetical protein
MQFGRERPRRYGVRDYDYDNGNGDEDSSRWTLLSYQ